MEENDLCSRSFERDALHFRLTLFVRWIYAKSWSDTHYTRSQNHLRFGWCGVCSNGEVFRVKVTIPFDCCQQTTTWKKWIFMPAPCSSVNIARVQRKIEQKMQNHLINWIHRRTVARFHENTQTIGMSASSTSPRKCVFFSKRKKAVFIDQMDILSQIFLHGDKSEIFS